MKRVQPPRGRGLRHNDSWCCWPGFGSGGGAEKKHGVGFKEATTVFGDPLGWFQADEAHSDSEERFLLLGRSSENRLLAVLFTDRGDELIRIISARLVTPRERRKYEKDFR